METGVIFGLEAGLLLGFEVAVDTDVSVLIETGVGFEAGFWCVTAFDNTVVMTEETHAPFKGCVRVVVLKGMGIALGLLDEFAVGYTGCRPVRREVVGIELEESFRIGHAADNDVFAVVLPFFDGVHRSPIGFEEFYRHEITHATCSRRGIGRKVLIMAYDDVHTVHYACFQMPWHVL